MLSSATRGGARSVPIAVGFGDEPSTCRFMAPMSVLLPEDRATTVDLGVLGVIGRIPVASVLTATKDLARRRFLSVNLDS
jgi:hypothetical protein